MLSLDSGCKGCVGLNANSSVKMVVGVLKFLDEGDGLLVGGSELSPH